MNPNSREGSICDIFASFTYRTAGNLPEDKESYLRIPYDMICSESVLQSALARAKRHYSQGVSKSRSPAMEFLRCLTGERNISGARRAVAGQSDAYACVRISGKEEETMEYTEGDLPPPACPAQDRGIRCQDCPRKVWENWRFLPTDIPEGKLFLELAMEKGALVDLDR